jgi:hypothetical protein
MSSTHSDSDSKKVYRQPEKPTISDIVVACKGLLSKVEGTCKQVDIYFNSCCWETRDLIPKDVRSKIETELLRVKFTPWEKFSRVLPWHQESDEDKRRVAVMTEHQQMIKKYVQQFHETRNRTLAVIKEYEDIRDTIEGLIAIWTRIVNGYAEKDFFDRTITHEVYSHIKQVTKFVEAVLIPAISGFISHSYDCYFFYRGNISFSEENGYIVNCYESSGRLCYFRDLHGILNVTTAIDMEKSIKKSLSESIAILEQSARFFSPPLPDKPSTQTA